MAITEKDIEHLKYLARLPASAGASQCGEFGAGETQKLAHDLGSILEYADTLNEADVSGVVETTHAVAGMKNVFRADAPVNKGGSAEDIIGAFPDKHDAGHGTYLKVRSIL